MKSNANSKTYRAGSALRALALVGASATAMALGAQPAFAQDSAPAADADEGQVILVTGSRIARPDLTSTVPATVVSQERIQETGATNIQETLSQLPQVGQGISASSSNFSNTGNGQATVNLRNLGSSRTLVLINGRRMVGIAGSSAVDINNIPTELIDRIDVVTGGASAVYGSDAISGVVNFILKDKFQGIAFHGQQRLSDKGDANDYYASLTAGTSFADGRGNIVANFSYDQNDGLRSRNRWFSAHDNPARSSYAAQGLFSAAADGSFSAANGATYTFDASNKLKLYQGANVDGYDRNQQRYLNVPVTRYLGALSANFELTDFAKVYAEGQYTRTESNASLEALAVANTGPGAALSFDESAYDGIPITSPYVPTAVRDAAIANGVSTLQFRRRSVDIFSRSNTNKRDYWRAVAGVKGDFTAGGKWSYDVSFEHSQTKDHTYAGAIYAPNYGAALSNQLDGSGNVICSDAAARAAGCAPINIFGFNTVSGAAAKFLQTYTGPTVKRPIYLDGDPTNTAPSNIQYVSLTNGQAVNYDYLAKVYQDVAAANLTGQLFSLWGSPIGVSVGGEYRKERSSEVFDPFTQLGLSSGNQISNTVGSFDVKEVYGEVVAPIVEDRPFLKYFGLEGAARYAHYSTVGGVWSWKIGGEYAPTSDIRFRAVLAQATRAPNISELFSARSQTFPAVVDPCDQNGGGGDLTSSQTPGSLPALAAACAAIPGVSKTIASRGAFYYTTSDIQITDGLLGGNSALKEEKASTFTAGAVLTPTMLRGFSLTVDYYSIKVKNAIGIIGQQVSVSECYRTGDPVFCSNVTRNPNTGLITRVNGLNLNTGSYYVSGLDIGSRYATSVGFLGEGGKFTADVQWNHRFKQEQTPYPGGTVQNEMNQADCYSCGRLGSGFADRVNASFTLGTPKYTLTYNVNYLGPLWDNLDGSVTPTHIQPYMYHNAKFSAKFASKYEFYAGVNNITDKTPPQLGDTNPASWPGTQTVATTYDVLGRMIYFGVNLKF